MEIVIRDDRKISSILEEFNTAFPYLRLEFFIKSNKLGSAFSKKFVNQDGKTLGECRVLKTKGSIKITPDMTVVDLEKGFMELYGLGVEVFRQSGKIWLETTVTDGWTLEEQNKQGESLSKKIG